MLNADSFVCVPITDYQVSQDTLRIITQRSSGTIPLDGQEPAVTLTTRGGRAIRLWIERDVWLPYTDILKMNLEEAGCSWFPAEHHPPPRRPRPVGHGGPARVRRALPGPGRQGRLRHP